MYAGSYLRILITGGALLSFTVSFPLMMLLTVQTVCLEQHYTTSFILHNNGEELSAHGCSLYTKWNCKMLDVPRALLILWHILTLCNTKCNQTHNDSVTATWWKKEAHQLMLDREMIAVCSQIHTKQINTLCGQNVELLNVKLAVHIVTTGL